MIKRWFLALLPVLALGLPALSRAGGPLLYVATGSGNAVVAVDAESGRVERRFEGVEAPHGLVVTPDGEYLFAGSLAPDPRPADPARRGRLYMIHPAHGHVMAVIPVTGVSHHQAVSADGRYVISTHPSDAGVSVVDVYAQRQVAFVDTGSGPNFALFGRDGKRLYVSNSASGTVSEITVPDWRKHRDLPAGPGPAHMALSADGARLYVVNPGPGQVREIDLEKGEITRLFELAPGLHGIALSDDGATLFVTAPAANALFRIDLDSGAATRVARPGSPYHMDPLRGLGLLYVSSRATPVAWLLRQADLSVASEIDLGAGQGHQSALVSP